MPVADDQVAALRLLLCGDADGHRQLYEQISSAADQEGYAALVAAAYTEAMLLCIDQYSAGTGPGPDAFRDRGHAGPATGTAADLTRGTPESSPVLQLIDLITDIQPSGEALDALLASARKLADQILEHQQHGPTAIPGVMVTALRTYLSLPHADPGADPRELGRQLFAQIKASGVAGLEVLVLAAFTAAARRHFAPAWTPAEAIRYVARVRSDSPELPGAGEPGHGA